jgi:hypothetical protein
MSANSLSEPWRSFLRDLEHELGGPTELHCFGGFVVGEHYGLTRPTADIDIIKATGATDLKTLAALAGKGSALAKQHRVYLDIVTVATVPENYEARLIDMFPGAFENLRLKAFERHDLVLAKLSRNGDRDREDVRRLAVGPGLDPEILRKRYAEELRFQSTNVRRDDLTLALWIEMIEEIEASAK